MKWVILLISFLTISFSRAQDNHSIQLDFKLGSMDTAIFKLEKLRFYVSNIHLLSQNSLVFSEKNSFHLVDLTHGYQSISMSIPDAIVFDSISFDIGIDSITNVSGIYSGDLDPTKGMYWTWQSGYINIKFEGVHANCPSKLNQIQLHLGGYLKNQLCVQSLKFPVTRNSRINLVFEITKFLNSLELSSEHTIMSPGFKAVQLAQKFASNFKCLE